MSGEGVVEWGVRGKRVIVCLCVGGGGEERRVVCGREDKEWWGLGDVGFGVRSTGCGLEGMRRAGAEWEGEGARAGEGLGRQDVCLCVCVWEGGR